MKLLLILCAGTAAFAAVTAAAQEAADAPADRLNVLFIVSDDLNNDLGCYGRLDVHSPNLDRLARMGVRFERAYCQYPVCNPSRASFMTGLYPEQTGVLSNGGDFRAAVPDVVTLPQHFRNHGYYAARVGKIYHYGVPNQIGTDGKDDPASWDEVVNPRGIDREVHDRIHTLQEGQFGGTLSWLRMDETTDAEHTDGIGATEAIALLEKHHPDQSGRPFFLAVGFYRPHTPYVAPGEHFDLHSQENIHPIREREDDRDDIPPAALADRPKQRDLTIDQRKEIIQAYYASVSLMDAQVGRLLEALDRLELADRTVIVFLSDHGYHLGHHGLWQKGDLFEGSARVPLIIRAPKSPEAGKSARAVVELIDLYPTLADLCGLPHPDHLKGKSLQPVLADTSVSVRPAALTVAWSRGRVPRGDRILGRTIRTARFRYTEWGENAESGAELYDYVNDPMEFTNFADDPEYASARANLEQLFTDAVAEAR